MKYVAFASLLFFCSSLAFSQTVDELRLTFDPAKIKAKQLSGAASADGNFLAFAYNNGKVNIFDVAAQKFKATVITSFKEFHDVRLTNDNKLIVTAGTDVKVYDWKTGQELKAFKLPGKMGRADFNAKHNVYVVGQMGGKFSSFDLNNLTDLYTNDFGGMMINAIALDKEAKYAVASFYKMGGKFPIKVFDIRTGEIRKEFDKEIYHALAFDPTGNLLAYGWGTGTFFFHIYDKDYNQVKKFETRMQTYGYVDGAFSGTKAIFTTASLTLDAYDINEQKLVYTSMADKSLVKIIGNYAYPKIIRLNDTKFMFSYGNDNISRIYDVSTNNVVAYFYNDGESLSCVVSKDGRIDGDMEALNSVYWTSRKSKTKTSLERTFERGFTPKLFSVVVSENNVTQRDFDVEGLTSSIPTLKISSINGAAYKSGAPVSSVQKNSKVDITLAGNVSDISEIRLYQNGKIVKTLPATGGNTYSADITLNSAFGEDNFIAAVAVTKAGVETERSKAVIQYRGASEAQPKIYMVTIGINEYKNPKYNLNYALADADGIQQSIQKSSSGLFSEVVQYSIRNDKAVKENIYKALQEIKGKALEQDLLVVYYAGHGVVSDLQGSPEFFLVMHDVTQLYGKPEVLAEKAISASEIKKLTQEINAQKQLFLLDACQSGAALESAASKRGVEEERAIAQLARSTGTFWITASGSTQYATEIEKLGHGIFTYTILEGLKGQADGNKDGKLSVRELSVFIEDQVPVLTEKYKGSAQYPSSYSFGNDFPLAIYK
jgi:WD40 repeat protein